MAKKDLDNSSVDINPKEEVKQEPVIQLKPETKYMMETFLEENAKTKSSVSMRAGFKAWHIHMQKNDPAEKRTISNWEQLLQTYLTRPINK